MYSDCDTPKGWVAPFGHSWIKACSQLPMTFRSVPRPSSPPGAKASTECPSHTQNRWPRWHSPVAVNISHHAQEPSTPRFNPNLYQLLGLADVLRCFEPAHARPILGRSLALRSRALLSAPNSAHTRKLLLPSRRAVRLQNASEHMCHRADVAAICSCEHTLTGQTCCRRRAQRRTRT